MDLKTVKQFKGNFPEFFNDNFDAQFTTHRGHLIATANTEGYFTGRAYRVKDDGQLELLITTANWTRDGVKIQIRRHIDWRIDVDRWLSIFSEWLNLYRHLFRTCRDCGWLYDSSLGECKCGGSLHPENDAQASDEEIMEHILAVYGKTNPAAMMKEYSER